MVFWQSLCIYQRPIVSNITSGLSCERNKRRRCASGPTPRGYGKAVSDRVGRVTGTVVVVVSQQVRPKTPEPRGIQEGGRPVRNGVAAQLIPAGPRPTAGLVKVSDAQPSGVNADPIRGFGLAILERDLNVLTACVTTLVGFDRRCAR